MAFAGDGAMQMNGMAELITAGTYGRSAATRGWSLRCSQQRPQPGHLGAAGLGGPPSSTVPALPDVAYAGFAPSLGLHGITVDDPTGRGGLGEALAADGRRARVRTDPAVPPIPPHATLDQIQEPPRRSSRATPTVGVIKEGVKTKIQEFLPAQDSD